MELENRTQHTYIIGATGQGKSTLLRNIILADIERGDGLLYIDPHGFDTDDILGRIPAHRRKDVILFDPSDYNFPIPWNPIEGLKADAIPLAATTIVDGIKDAWDFATTSTANMDMYLYSITVSLIESKQTLLGMPFMLTSKAYRTKVLAKSQDPMVRFFWTQFYATLSKTDQGRQVQSTLNKSFVLFSDPRIRHMLGQKDSAFQLSDIIKDRKILLARLPQGQLGIHKTKLIGSLLLSQFHLAALGREPGPVFHVHLDEMHTFAGHTLELMLSGIRKFNISLTMVHQYLDQLTPGQQSAVLGNVGTKIFFRVSQQDARTLAGLMPVGGYYTPLDELAPFHVRKQAGPEPEQHIIEDDLPPYDEAVAAKIMAHTRRHYATKRADVEGYVRRFIERA
jgi:type IV secretory pathway TraG/TraD family ATPase VirD4